MMFELFLWAVIFTTTYSAPTPPAPPTFATVYVTALCSDTAFDVQIHAGEFRAQITGLCRSGRVQYYRCQIPVTSTGTEVQTAYNIPGGENGGSTFTVHPGSEVAREFRARGGHLLIPLGTTVFTRETWSVYSEIWPGDTSFGTPDIGGSRSDNPACVY